MSKSRKNLPRVTIAVISVGMNLTYVGAFFEKLDTVGWIEQGSASSNEILNSPQCSMCIRFPY